MKLIKKMIAASLALALVLSMSGCYWNGKTYSQSKNILLDALEAKYGEEFKILSLRTGSGGGHLETGPLLAYCSPKDNEDLVFEAKYVAYGTLADTYIQSIVRKQMKEQIDTVLSEYFDNYASEVLVRGLETVYDSGITNSEEASIESYTNVIPENLNSIWIILDEQEVANDYDKIKPVVSQIVENFHLTNTSIDCFFVPSNIVENAIEISTDQDPSVTSMRALVDGRYSVYKFYYWGNTATLELLEMKIL